MTISAFRRHILHNMPFIPTLDQDDAINVYIQFLASRDGRATMILRGSAGTGKTTLVAAMVKTLMQLQQKVILLAPTGRAAKVLSLNCAQPASTIHRKIYRQKTGSMEFSLDINLHCDTLFVVDEASMIAGDGVLDDLINYVYSGRNCQLMLIGDKAQLPPVGEEEAPALQRYVLECYGLTVFECDLNEVVRQDEESGILWNATKVRQMITHDAITQLPRMFLRGFTDIVSLPGNEIIESLEDSYYRMGQDETIVVTRSNKTANIYNNGIRARVLDHEGELTSGDRIMIVKNHYFDNNGNLSPLTFLANGDMAEVRRVRRVRELHGFRFADLVLRFPDYDDAEIEMTAILDTLQSEAPALTAEQQQQLYESCMADYADLPYKADRLKALKKDIYYNALQIKFAYAVTCHKAQGGQWAHVYVDQGYMTDDMLTPDYVHWLYTAITRATEKLFLVNWPKTQVE